MVAYQATKKTADSVATKTPFNIYQDCPSARALDETVDDFLARLPPRTSRIGDCGPWIFISNPHCTGRKHLYEDTKGFRERGEQLLSNFNAAKVEIESSMAGKPKSVIGRKLTPLRSQLEKDVFEVARKSGVTSGKWMLFPSPENVNHVWSLVAHATASEDLGHAAKVAADDGSGDKARLICVYNEDYADKKEVKRVLQQLNRLGLAKRTGLYGNDQAIYYKADAYTTLDIVSGNQWGLKPSIYSSTDVLKDDWHE